ncbi:DUF2867 domain-containing protein [Kribbella antibiotica]|uniref:DUF2867 domain-containing protein n=1 Tax=Kribbella antibiotica TaxID=190195 RepID=A0A4R4ZV09_9ACTN|nr:DUF2867 domain-containing protein [Kribbella antibiotica]TDD62993.1 DUF2867 domain-containing protein [Kribbella antibiotica]
MNLPELDDLLPTADEIDVKTAHGPVTLREFTAGALAFNPWWLKSLYGVRVVLATVMRLGYVGIPNPKNLRPETLSFTPGAPASFFTVERGEEDHYLLIKVSDNHLVAYLAFITDNYQPATFTVVTLVQYLRPAGRLYYRAIKPFHHLVVRSMCTAGLTTFGGKDLGLAGGQ